MNDMILRLIFAPNPSWRASVGLLAARVFLGVGIAFHGYGKLGNIGGFAEGIGVPYFLAAGAVYSEFFGGILFALGLLTPLTAAALTGTMFVAMMYHVTGGDGFLVVPNGAGGYTVGWELAALYFFPFLAFLFVGPGRLSIDAFLFKKWMEPGEK